MKLFIYHCSVFFRRISFAESASSVVGFIGFLVGFFFTNYGCETWSLTLREERNLRVFESMVLRRIFGPRRDEVMGEWRRLHNEELNGLYC